MYFLVPCIRAVMIRLAKEMKDIFSFVKRLTIMTQSVSFAPAKEMTTELKKNFLDYSKILINEKNGDKF